MVGWRKGKLPSGLRQGRGRHFDRHSIERIKNRTPTLWGLWVSSISFKFFGRRWLYRPEPGQCDRVTPPQNCKASGLTKGL